MNKLAGKCIIVVLVFALVAGETLTRLKRRRLLMISFDGLRADKLEEFLREHPSSFFNNLISNGLKATYMTPVFPSISFPNHYSMVTGIVDNVFYDPKYDSKINLLSDKNAADIKWWNNSEPVWVTARKKGLKTASISWPGGEVWGQNTDIYLPYSLAPNFISRIDEMINWFSTFNIDFALLYFNEPDLTGHTFGPNHYYYQDMIKHMDSILGYILNKLEKNKLLSKMNLIILSDHGMELAKGAPVYVTNHSNLSVVDLNKSHFDSISNIYPKSYAELNELYVELEKLPHTKVYNKYDVPAHLHYTKSTRIAPFVAICDAGYYLTIDPTDTGYPGIHGYDPESESMRTVFLAVGPNFKKDSKMKEFSIVNVYALVCKLLDLECHPSNGTFDIFEPYINSSMNSHSFDNFYFLCFIFLISYFNF